MDYGIIAGVNPPDASAGGPGVPPYAAFEAARYAMGDTLRYAQKLNLIQMEPHNDLSSTGYLLASPGQEYLTLQPSDTKDPFTVTLEKGSYAVEWFSINNRETKTAKEVTVKRNGKTTFTPPFAEAGPAVLYLKQT
jgi:hypothetical protein